ncbi:MAG: exonuclease SbcCD subunit D [Candidatus Verstraetearchaeota archaeon]|nr:exonuclease SbcCD subunit D [Candidatus Verstraetearchaeota archaeon]
MVIVMVRVAHVADTHLGFRQYNIDEREHDLYEVMDEIADKIIEERAEIVIHSGDLFDSPRPLAQAYYAFKKFLAKLEGKVKVFSILGDHDTPKRRGMPPQRLFDDRMQILGLTGGEYQTLNLKGQEVLIAGISHVGRRYRELLVEELKKLDSIAAKYPISILALHQAIDRFFALEGAYELRMDELPRNFKYYAMGHLHSRVQASFGNGELAYSGSTEIIRSTEIAEWEKRGKGFYIVDINGDNMRVEEVNLIKIRPQFRIKIDYANFDEELKRLVGIIGGCDKPPVVHITVEGKEIDRQRVHQALNEVLAGKVLHFRSQIVEKAEKRLIELKTGEVNIQMLLREYLKDEKIAEFGYELFKVLRFGEVEEAKRIVEDYFRRMKQNVVKEGTS